MKNKLLWTTLFVLFCTQIHAELKQELTPAAKPDSNLNAAVKTNEEQSLTNQNPVETQNVGTNPSPVIDCNYRIPVETKNIEQSLLLTWSEKALNQAFTFAEASLDEQMQKLQACFTEQGWVGFNNALKKSGNLEAIKAQKLKLSSQVQGAAIITEAKENQWKLTIPLEVVYQNDQQKVSQLLHVDLTVTRKINGDLGISQMIATPKEAVTTENPSTGSASSNNLAPNNEEKPKLSTTPEAPPLISPPNKQ